MTLSEFDITITLTPEQRVILINALTHWVKKRKDKYDSKQVNELHNMVASTKCGNKYCSYCGEYK